MAVLYGILQPRTPQAASKPNLLAQRAEDSPLVLTRLASS
jgi:hypothetical protein